MTNAMQSLPDKMQKLAVSLDSRLAGWNGRRAQAGKVGSLNARFVETPVGPVRLVDTESVRPCVVLVPDGPNVIEHYAELIQRLSPDLRVVCFDMPGFGFSLPRADYRHSLDQGARAVLGVLDALSIPRATLAFSCANGFYALRAARLAPARVASLLLSQTPSLDAMLGWAERVIPAPLRVPVVGQTIAWLSRKALAERWYAMALPRTTEREPFRAIARDALAAGACFSLAGVVQGLKPESQSAIDNLSTPCTLLWGGSDRTHRGTDPDSLRDCAKDVQIERFDALGHFPDLEQPERFAERLLAQVARYP